jgi:acetyl-CoA carboxylase biotin carboxyl carrier protein
MTLIDIPAPMTGTVKEILVSVGDQVAAGQEIMVLESMKMEIPIESPAAGRVAEVAVEVPQRVEEGNLLLRVEG